jgi:hypothetical protein
MSIAASGDTATRLDIGETLQDVVNVILRNLGPVVLLAVLLEGVPLALLYLGNELMMENPVFILLGLIGLIAQLVGRSILYGALIVMTVRDLDGEPATLREALAGGQRKWGSLLGLMIVTGLAIGVGLVLLIVPGVYLALRWAVAGPSKVLTGRSISDSMAHSTSLTEGRRWSMLLVYVIVFVVAVVVAMAFGLVEYVLGLVAPKALVSALVEPLPNLCYDIPVAVVAAVLYRRLRSDAEGPASAVLAEVFA